MEHEDYLFEVECKCGMRFNPFYDVKTGDTGSTTNAEDPGTGGDRSMENPLSDFSESRTAFQEIVQFGETMNEPPKPKAKTPPTVPAPKATSKAPPISSLSSDTEVSSMGSTSSADRLITNGPTVPGYENQTYFLPVSAWTSTDTDNPLGPGFETLWNAVVACGANALTCVHWKFSPDGTRILISGIPVLCVKVG